MGLVVKKRAGKELMAIPRVEKSIYFGFITEEKGDINKDINQCVRVGW